MKTLTKSVDILSNLFKRMTIQSFKLFPLVLFFTFPFVWGCGTTKMYEKSVFTFNYDGYTYEIVSMSLPDRVGYNLLQLYSEEGEIILQARDSDSNGSLDILLIGDLTLTNANEIYSLGIDEAISRGQFESRSDLRRYELVGNEGIYVVETIGYDEFLAPRKLIYGYLSEPVQIYNKFTIFDLDGQIKMEFRDMDANGMLKIERQVNIAEDLHELYSMVLENGIQEGRIEKIQNMYVVQRLNG